MTAPSVNEYARVERLGELASGPVGRIVDPPAVGSGR
jgi:hypothetical protein